MNEPTYEQIKELWEWCGFKRLPQGKQHFHYERGEKVMNWMPPNETEQWRSVAFLPRLDLNYLFKYAVPKLQRYELWSNQTWDDDKEIIVQSGDQGAFALLPPNKIGTSADKDPALALFWAIWEIIKDML